MMASRNLPITPERWRQLHRLFDEVVELQAAGRAARLAQEPDVSLREDVVALLAAHEQADAVLHDLEQAMVPASVAPVLEGTTVSHYHIEECRGGGGMGVVYKARDVKLDRTVALKFLPLHLSSSEEAKARFRKEAKAASALDHPNICTVYEIGEHEAALFIAMAFYEGETLEEKISRGPTPVDEAIDYAIQVAEGLARAHEAKLVHRDIKAANVMVTERGRVKIVDFGLVKVAGAELTKEGAMLGTIAYMSPEQTRGEAIDARTDLWSLGVVLYEMLTGQRPFRGEHDRALIHAIRYDHPEPVEHCRAEIPDGLARIVQRCLEKDAEARYPTAEALLTDLRLVEARGAVTQKRRRVARYAGWIGLFVLTLAAAFFVSRQMQAPEVVQVSAPAHYRLAVLPFTNLRADPEANFLGYALADQIIAEISYLEEVLARPSSTVHRYQGQRVDPLQVAQELNVEYVLAGSYLKQDDTLRMNLELVEAASNTPLWRESIEIAYGNLFRVQDLVAKQVSHGLALQLTPQQQARLLPKAPRSIRAYEYYLSAVAMPRDTEEDNRQAQVVLQRSLALDPTYAPAIAEMGYRYYMLSSFHLDGAARREAMREAEAHLLKSLSLDEDLLIAQGNLATLYAIIGRVEESVAVSRRTLQINPKNFDAHYNLGLAYGIAGAHDAALRAIEQARVLDPNNRKLVTVGYLYTELGKCEEALEAFAPYAETMMAIPFGQGWCLYELGRLQRARERFETVIDMEPESEIGLLAATYLALLDRKASEGLTALRKMEETCYPNLDENPDAYNKGTFYFAGRLYIALGDESRGMQLIKYAIEQGYFNYPLMKADPMLNPVRGEPAFERILTHAKVRHEAFMEAAF